MVKKRKPQRLAFIGHVKSKFLPLIIPCIALLVWQYIQERKTSVQFLDRDGATQTVFLSVKEKQRLLGLMRLLFAEDSFAYTLLGSKPVSWACYKKPLPFVGFAMIRDSLTRYNRTMYLGWKVWSKYRHLFPVVNFWEETSKSQPGWVSLLIVNEEWFNCIVNDYKQDFQNVLHRDFVDGFQLLQEAKNRSLMADVLERHQALIGIVLGYGRNNSWEFLEKSDKRELLRCVWDDTDNPERNGIQTRIAATHIEECLSLESLPTFAGDPTSEESLLLKKDYLLTQQKIIAYYKDKDFLEATLSLLAGFHPD